MKMSRSLEVVLGEAFDRRGPLLRDPATDSYRLFNGDRDGIDGLTVDIYGDYLLVQTFREDIAADEDRIAREAMRVLAMRGRDMAGLLVKRRLKARDGENPADLCRSRVVEGSPPPEGYTVTQGGIRAVVDLVSGLNTGLFLDMREVREALADSYRSGDRVLNLFCYTGLFSVHAIKHGAASALNVDLSKGVLARARDNYRSNGLPCDDRDFIFGDAFQWMKRLRKRGDMFNFAIFDPPTFSRNRKTSFSVKKDYTHGLADLSALVPDGYVLTSVNSHSVSRKEYRAYHPSGWKCLWIMQESSDFMPGKDSYLKVGLWKTKIS